MLHKLQVIFGRVFGAWTSSKYIHYSRQFTLQLRHYWLPTMATGKLDSPEFKALLTPGKNTLLEQIRYKWCLFAVYIL